ncbi:hypothetical protein AB0B50_20230 [Streptomyces sp. NPDC041068]|uniref:hypothetical protein n=1 Tax=Streptomyces sp. NPDC041068 TaxID=3155130 RepID=UPI0033F4CC7D
MNDVKIIVERRYAPDPFDYERLVPLVESTGERVALTEANEMRCGRSAGRRRSDLVGEQ